MAKQSSTKWITIEEDSVLPKAAPKSSASHTGSKKGMNKFMWGGAFGLLLVIVFALVAPNQFAGLLRGSLFDTPATDNNVNSFGVRPVSIVPTDASSEPAPAPTPSGPADSGLTGIDTNEISDPVVTADTEATTIAIEPVADAETIEIETTPEPVAIEDENAAVLDELRAQIEELKAQNEALEGDLRPSAPEAPVTGFTAPATTFQGFRANPYTVQVSPQQVLQQNLSGGSQYVATPVIRSGSLNQVTPVQNYGANLASAQGTPETGPATNMLIMLAFIAMLSWKAKRLFIKAK